MEENNNKKKEKKKKEIQNFSELISKLFCIHQETQEIFL